MFNKLFSTEAHLHFLTLKTERTGAKQSFVCADFERQEVSHFVIISIALTMTLVRNI